MVELRTVLPLTVAAACAVLMMVVAAKAEDLKPGYYGFNHEKYHHFGSVQEFERLSKVDCCDDHGECRGTLVQIRSNKVMIDGMWCPINNAPVRYDVALPDSYAMACAAPSQDYESHHKTCPTIYCLAVPPGL